MDRERFKEVISLLNTIYSDKPPCPNQITFDTWYALFRNHDESVVKAAAQMYISTEHFAPKPADILELCAELQKDEERSPLEAWNIAYKAICNGYYNYKAEFAKLPPIIQRVIGKPENLKEMAQMDINTVNSVEQSHFIKLYNAELAREKTINMLPENIRQGLAEINKRYALPDDNSVLVIESKNEPYVDNRVDGTEYVERLKTKW
jgi:hypothetical protein